MDKADVSLMEREKITILIYTESFSNCPHEIEYFEKASLFNEFDINYLPILNNALKVNVAQSKYKHIREQNIVYSVIELKMVLDVLERITEYYMRTLMILQRLN